jgi:predicted heme/steroid binding protein
VRDDSLRAHSRACDDVKVTVESQKTGVPVRTDHGSGDIDTDHTAGYALADELEHRHKPRLLKTYPTVGRTSEDGHNFLYLAIPQWEDDVLVPR